MVAKMINNIETVFPESSELSFQKLADLIAEALLRAYRDGMITEEQLQQLEKENMEDYK